MLVAAGAALDCRSLNRDISAMVRGVKSRYLASVNKVKLTIGKEAG